MRANRSRKGGLSMAQNNSRRSGRVVYSAYITRNGKRIYAATYGLKAFCFVVRDKGSR
jgi:hypothetical protein